MAVLEASSAQTRPTVALAKAARVVLLVIEIPAHNIARDIHGRLYPNASAVTPEPAHFIPSRRLL
jgi:hypothetical protein